MEIRSAVDGDLAAMAELAARLQSDPATAIAYLGVEQRGIVSELDDIDWHSVSAVVFDDGRLVGWLVGEIDDELGRVFWLGPFVAADNWEDAASQLYLVASKLLPPHVTEQEMAIDSRFERYQSWAAMYGFAADEGSLAFVLNDDLGPSEIELRSARDADLSQLGALHEALFPGTHTTGRQLVEGRDVNHIRLLAEIDGCLAGYVAFEVQPDGSGYLDFLGVATEFRRRGLGAQLVRAAVAGLLDRGAVTDPPDGTREPPRCPRAVCGLGVRGGTGDPTVAQGFHVGLTRPMSSTALR